MRKKINSKFALGILFLFVILLSISLVSSTYVRTVTSGAQYALTSGVSGFGSTQSLKFDKSMCGERGQDLLVQIVPFGCTPSVIRSDLLEEQDAQILCQLGATQINPLIDIETIDYMTITGDYPREVKSVGYFPSQAALGTIVSNELELNSPILSNLGYVVITLRHQSNESAMPDYVSGNLTAKIRYDIKSAFGVGNANFYLPVLNDEEWNEKYEQYSFWQGRGYLRAISTDDNGAQIAVYADDSVVKTGAFSREGKTYSKTQYSSFYLKEGEQSNELYLPGFSPCLATLNVRLADLVNPDTLIKLKVGSDYVEVKPGEKFLDNNCWVNKNPDKNGLYQSIKVSCNDDEKPITTILSFSPRVKLSIDGEEGEYEVGDWLFTTEDGEKSVYLGYVDSFEDSEKTEDLYVLLIALPEHKDELSASELASVNSHANAFKTVKTGATVYDKIASSIKAGAEKQMAIGKQLIKGEEFLFVSYKNQNTGVISPSENFKGKQIYLTGFGEGEDREILAITEEEYVLTSSSGKYIIKDSNGESTELVLNPIKVKGNLRLVLKKEGLTLSGKYGTFYPENDDECKDYESCSKLTFSIASSEISKDNSFFENFLGAEVFPKETKLVVYRALFDDSSETTFNIYYENAMKDFKTIETGFSNEQDSENSENTYGEEALSQSIILAKNLNKKKTMLELCERFEERYSKSLSYSDILKICENEYHTSSDKLSSMDVMLQGVITSISFEGISEPRFENYGVELLVQGPNGESRTLNLEKDKTISLDNFRTEPVSQQEYVKLGTLTTGSASIYVSVGEEEGVQKAFVPSTINFELDSPQSRGEYTFTLKKINLGKSARVLITGNTNYEYTEAKFGFKVGIEKRSFPLTPEKASKRIESLTKNIEDFKKASEVLSTTVTVMKDACLITGGALVLKNLVTSFDGKSIARQMIMRGDEGWTEKCTVLVEKGDYSSLDQCFLKKSDTIDSEVNDMYSAIQNQNDKIKTLENAAKDSQTGNVNIDKVVEGLSSQTVNGLDSSVQTAINKINPEKPVDFTKVDNNLDINRFKENAYSLDQLKDIALYTEVLKTSSTPELKSTATERLYNILSSVETNSQIYEKQETFKGASGLDESSSVIDLLGRKTQEIQANKFETFSTSAYSGKYTFPNVLPIDKPTTTEVISGNEYVYAVKDKSDGKEYLVVYNKDEIVSRTYKIDNSAKTLTLYIGENGKISENPLNLNIKVINEESLSNTYKNAKINYYEEAPYKGVPAIVPFGIKEGWYAAIKPFVTSESLQAVDDSGVVKVFWICNVGKDGLEEFFSSSRDDVCQMYNLRTGQSLNEFGGLNQNKASAVISKGQEAISQAQKQYASGVSKVRINLLEGGFKTFNVGTPAVEIPEYQCQDFMSPKECNILFNVCDPVICPSSRCDLGGTYPVQDVIQSGIIGSIALCLPNAKEGIIIPVCISGVQAGLDGFISVQESYKDCLQTNIDTGATVGICDEVYSIYMCDFFWKQAIPLAKLTVPKVLSAVFGQNARGGGEYLGVKDAFSKAKESIEFFKSNYAANSWKAFKIRSTNEVGSEVCQNFPSIVTFDVKNLLSDLTEPDSPFQFTGNFKETVMTTATNPAISHYKVFYHIYAGKDAGAYYQVYLRQGTGSSYYQDTNIDRRVASGYIEIGGYATNTTDFTAPSGYKQLCISVNGQEDCSFEQVSTSFALDYLSEMYVLEQSTKQVTTEAECISGTASLYSILNVNVQSIVEELIDPKIYENGIIRTCATENPGKTTDTSWEDSDNARWVSVGYCGDTNVKCWMDRDKVKEIVKSLNIENEIVEKTSENYAEILFKEGDYITTEEFKDEVKKINEEEPLKKIELINELFPKVFFNNQKARLFLMRGKAYAELALSNYITLKKELEEKKAAEEVVNQKLLDEMGCDAEIGEKILSIANNKIGTDTTRTQNGKEVYDNVCATFVSKVLIEAGVFGKSGTCKPDEPYVTMVTQIVSMFQASENEYSYFNEIDKAYWKTGLMPGDIITWGCKELSSCSKKPNADEYQHITIFSNYAGTGGITVIHDPGKEATDGNPKVKSSTYSNPIDSRTWYITHVWRAGCSENPGTTTSDNGITINPGEDIFNGKEIPEEDIEPEGGIGRGIYMLKPSWLQKAFLSAKTIYYKYDNGWKFSFTPDVSNSWKVVGSEKNSFGAELSEMLNGESYHDGLQTLKDNEAVNEDGSEIIFSLTSTGTTNPDGGGTNTGGTSTGTTTSDLTPRIAYWCGKINQHTQNGVWISDPDKSGCIIDPSDEDKLSYCQKWYLKTTSVEEYKKETINTWKDSLGNTFSQEVQTYKCVTTCLESCLTLGYECGYHQICGGSVLCGSCSEGKECNDEEGKCLFEIFVIKSLISKDVYYRHNFNGGVYYWEWSMDKINWMVEGNTMVASGDNIGESPSNKNKKIILYLEDKNYIDGKRILIDEGAKEDSLI